MPGPLSRNSLRTPLTWIEALKIFVPAPSRPPASAASRSTWVGVAFVSKLVPEVEAVSLHFVFKDYDHAMRAVDGTVGKHIEAKLSAKGFTALAWMELGARHVTNSKRPLRTLNDFKGLKIRMQPVETHLAAFRALGASPVAMDIKDVYVALQQGHIDGQENPYSVIHANKYFESQNTFPIPATSWTSSSSLPTKGLSRASRPTSNGRSAMLPGSHPFNNARWRLKGRQLPWPNSRPLACSSIRCRARLALHCARRRPA
jgi:Bacterial extracellular solute-binding protein, family 7